MRWPFNGNQPSIIVMSVCDQCAYYVISFDSNTYLTHIHMMYLEAHNRLCLLERHRTFKTRLKKHTEWICLKNHCQQGIPFYPIKSCLQSILRQFKNKTFHNDVRYIKKICFKTVRVKKKINLRAERENIFLQNFRIFFEQVFLFCAWFWEAINLCTYSQQKHFRISCNIVIKQNFVQQWKKKKFEGISIR